MTENLRHDQEWWKFMEYDFVPYMEFKKRAFPEDEEVTQLLERNIEAHRKTLLKRSVRNRPSESDKRFDMFIDFFLKTESGVGHDDAIESVAKHHGIPSSTINNYFERGRHLEERDSALQLAKAIVHDTFGHKPGDIIIAISRSESRTAVTDFAHREELRKLYPRAAALVFQQEFLGLYPLLPNSSNK